MNILIVGDSWSKPDGYSDPILPPYNNETILPLEYYLLSIGHRVFNRGEGGRGNNNSIKIADYFLRIAPRVGIEIDLVIFFNSDLSRDRIQVVGNNYPNNLTELTNILYKDNLHRLEVIRSFYKGKWAVIGGCAPLMNPDDFKFADFVIPDWRSEILGYKLEGSQWLYDYPFLQNFLNDENIEEVDRELKKVENIFNQLKDKPNLFPDGSHPSMKHQLELGIRIDNYFKWLATKS